MNAASHSPPQHSNRLIGEKSPYLQQHAHNPVDWYPWGDEAFAKARAEEKPILLSIGYSTCHWCHVMERESFTDDTLGAYLKEHFISIKVDREERPDIDKIYMTFAQLTTGSGGWPLNVFLTPDLKPFYAGTYFPPEPKHGRPSFRQLLERITELWKTKRADITESAGALTERLKGTAEHEAGNAFPAGERELRGAGQAFLHEYDPVHGGFGHAPKFPRPSQPLFLLRYARRFGEKEAVQAVLHTCTRMAAGGMYDQLGGGFSRYSVDERWLVPHFEKMLYDNAQLVQLFLDAHLVSGDVQYAGVVRDILHYVKRDMTHRDGGFFSAEDADSEGKEGKFYCWTNEELSKLLTTDEFKGVSRYFGITVAGNFVDHSDPHPLPGQNILSVVDPKLTDTERATLSSARQKLMAVRTKRVRPHLDDKILSSWNGMMLGAIARAYAILGDEEFRETAERNLEFIRTHLWDTKEKALHLRWRDGGRDSLQLLDAYANLLSGVLDLYEATLDPAHLQFAVELAEAMMRRFHDSADGGFWQTSADTPHLLVRVKEDYDGAEPSGNSVAALALLKLAAICDRKDWREAAEKTIRLFAQRLHQTPHGVPHLLLALDFALQEPKRIIIVGDWLCGSTRALLRAAHGTFEPHKVVMGNHGLVESFARTLKGSEEYSLAFCCTATECRPPTRDSKVVNDFLRAGTLTK
ncbi:MAG: thioredoxin domain-containing protein [Pedosphaera sp.]|nr:thioredoxin domain-containing protein [Pedosphaera sp.]